MTTRGRRTRLDEDQRREILAMVELGACRGTAARSANCSPVTLARTCAHEPDFSRQLERAEAQHEILLLRQLQAAASEEKNWRACAWWLEHAYAERYGTRKADSIGRADATRTLEQLAALLLEAVPDRRARQTILARLQCLQEVRVVEACTPPTPTTSSDASTP